MIRPTAERRLNHARAETRRRLGHRRRIDTITLGDESGRVPRHVEVSARVVLDIAKWSGRHNGAVEQDRRTRPDEQGESEAVTVEAGAERDPSRRRSGGDPPRAR